MRALIEDWDSHEYRKAAVKMIPSHCLLPERKKCASLLCQEARIMAIVGLHPNIVQLLGCSTKEIGNTDKLIYLFMLNVILFLYNINCCMINVFCR